MAKANPFAGKQAPPFGAKAGATKGAVKGAAKGAALKKAAKPNPFAKLKEGSPAEEKMDAMQGFKKGGAVRKK